MSDVVYRDGESYRYLSRQEGWIILPNDIHLFYEFLWFCHKNNYENNIKYMETKDDEYNL